MELPVFMSAAYFICETMLENDLFLSDRPIKTTPDTKS
jgi:hypothetical protein